MNKTVVIGMGNPLRGDDGAGWAVVDALWANPIAGVTAVSTHQFKLMSWLTAVLLALRTLDSQ